VKSQRYFDGTSTTQHLRRSSMDLLEVRGNKSFRDTIERLADELRRK